ncbi:MAG: hypothetical protein KAQ68_05215 [Clostridiales bacterium]|nr:hypothetical protein [Clostridiales bacterium]
MISKIESKKSKYLYKKSNLSILIIRIYMYLSFVISIAIFIYTIAENTLEKLRYSYNEELLLASLILFIFAIIFAVINIIYKTIHKSILYKEEIKIEQLFFLEKWNSLERQCFMINKNEKLANPNSIKDNLNFLKEKEILSETEIYIAEKTLFIRNMIVHENYLLSKDTLNKFSNLLDGLILKLKHLQNNS